MQNQSAGPNATFTKKQPAQFIPAGVGAGASQITHGRDMSSENKGTIKHQHGSGGGVMTTTQSGPEYVSIRYFAPVSQVNPRIMKGEMMNPHLHQPIKRDTSRPKLTTPINPGIHFAPNIDPSFSFNFNGNPSNQAAVRAGPQQQPMPLMVGGPPPPQGPYHDFAISPYRMLNFEHQMKQMPPQFVQSSNSLNTAANEMQITNGPGTAAAQSGKQTQQEQSYQRPVSSMWNMAGGAGNTGSLSHKFMSEYSDELKNYGNYFGTGGSGGNGGGGGQGGFFTRFVGGAGGGDKQFKSGAKYGFFVGMFLFVVALMVGAAFLGIFLSGSKCLWFVVLVC